MHAACYDTLAHTLRCAAGCLRDAAAAPPRAAAGWQSVARYCATDGLALARTKGNCIKVPVRARRIMRSSLVDLTKTTGDDANIWRRPDPKKDFVLAVAFAVQRGYAAQIRSCAPTRVAAIVALQPSSNMKI
jgi:hypothetical protein